MTIEITNRLISLRPITDEDVSFLCKVYGSTREKELRQVEYWTEVQKQEFINQQFAAQHEYYQKNYIGGDFYVIEFKKEDIGRLYIHGNFQNAGIRIIDIAILPNWQNQAIGSSLLKDILLIAENTNRHVSIHVESFNPAKKLYEKLGFKKISETNGVYHLMEWRAPVDMGIYAER